MPSPIFELRDVSYSYAAIPAVQGVSLTVESGQRVAVLGANGSGKSTLLKLLDGLYFPDAGQVRFDGNPLTEAALNSAAFTHSFRRRVGLVFQNPDVQLFNPTVFDELAFGPLQLRLPPEEIRRRVAQTLEELELSHLASRPPHRLSGGEKKRVALASVLVMDPEVLLLDEPTAGLDPKSQSQIIDFIAGWQGDKTVITSTHDLDIVADIADVCLVFQAGRLVTSGASASILNDLPLLERTHLIHAHRHRHASGLVHSHPHLHGSHGHEHT